MCDAYSGSRSSGSGSSAEKRKKPRGQRGKKEQFKEVLGMQQCAKFPTAEQFNISAVTNLGLYM